MKKSLLTMGSLLAAGFMSVSVLQAQEAPAPGGAGRPDRPGGPRGAGMGIGLDDKQRELLREALQKNNEELRKLGEKYQAAQKELVEAAVAEKYDEKTVREKADALSKIQADMMALRAKAFSSVAPTLKPEQREQLLNSRMGAAMVLGGMGGGGMMGGGPGGPAGDGRPPRRGGGGGAGAPAQ